MKSSAIQRKTEQFISWMVLLLLAVIALAVFARQFEFNPAVLIAHAPVGSKPVSFSAINPGWLPPEVKEFGVAEQFTPDNLYDKIDGKAELYLSTGISRMDCQRFVLKAAPDDWFEWFCYGMNGVPQAFSAFSTQRRAEGETLDLTPYAYRTQNALFFVCGTNYIEAVGSSASGPLLAAMIEMAKRYVAAASAGAAQMPEMQVLPTNNLVAGSITLQTTDAFGFDGFKNVFTAGYSIDGSDVMGFATACDSPAAAAALRDAYGAFLVANGGKELAGAEPAGGKTIEIMGTFEIILCRGSYVVGVHAAPTLAAATRLAETLQHRLAESAK